LERGCVLYYEFATLGASVLQVDIWWMIHVRMRLGDTDASLSGSVGSERGTLVGRISSRSLDLERSVWPRVLLCGRVGYGVAELSIGADLLFP
jgi:hypothetical protein